MLWTKIAISGIAVGAGAVRLIWPDARIDAVSLGLLVVAVLPWVAVLFESLELPGGWKIAFRDLERVAQALPAEVNGTQADADSQPSYLLVQGLDPELALVGLRIEIERRLQELAVYADIPERGRPMSARVLLRELHDHIPANMRAALDETLAAGNAAAHGATLPDGQKDFAFAEGRRLLQWLDNTLAAYRGQPGPAV